MKKLLIITMLLVTNLAWSAALDLKIWRRNAANTVDDIIIVTHPVSGNGILFYNGSTNNPQLATFGTNVSITSGVLNVTQTQADWSALSGDAFIHNKPINLSAFTNDMDFITGTSLTTTLGSYALTSALTAGLAAKADSSSIATVGHSGDYNDLGNKPTLGTAAPLNVAASGDASSGQVVKGSDTRLTDSRAPLAHTQAASTISDSTTVGRAVLTAADAAAARTAIGAGTGNGSVTSVAAGAGLSGGTITTTGTISMPNTGTAGTYNGSVTTDAQGRVTAGTSIALTHVTKTLNSCFQLSSTKLAHVTYNAEIASSAAIVGGQRGTLYLETFTDSGCTTGTVEIMSSTNGNTSALIVAVGNVITQTLNVNGYVAAGLYVKLRTENNTGTPTFTAKKGQEALF